MVLGGGSGVDHHAIAWLVSRGCTGLLLALSRRHYAYVSTAQNRVSGRFMVFFGLKS
jgi:hypothetical protein